MSVFKYHILAFFSGAVVLVIEILGARILAPYLGTAFFVWVNIIGVILAALSLGYWLGGKLADRRSDLLPHIFLLGAFTTIVVTLERGLLPSLGILGIRSGSLIASMVLFAPVSVVLGMVSPYIIKLAAKDLAHLGQTSGSIFAASTLGSIAGTFVTGFLFIPHFTLTHILWGATGILAGLAVVSAHGHTENHSMRPGNIFFKVGIGIVLFTGIGFAGSKQKTETAHIIFEKNSQYYNIRVHDQTLASGFVQRSLLLDGSTQSARYVGAGGFPYAYIDLSAKLIAALKPNPAHMLALGGGGYSIPEFVKKTSPQSEVLVVEIDPEVTVAAKRFFLEDPYMDIKTITADARVFLNNIAKEKTATDGYDLIYTDAYSGAFSVPGHLATYETFLAMRNTLTKDGMVIFNIASALEGTYARLFLSLWKTADAVFPEKAIFATAAQNPAQIQNIILVAGKGTAHLDKDALAAFGTFRYRRTPDATDAIFLTDDFAPTDSLVEKMVAEIYPRLRQYQK